MNKIKSRGCILLVTIICFILYTAQDDYQMMCTFESNPIAKIFTMSDEGDIVFDNDLEVGGNPNSLCFSPNGKWGMIGSHTTSYPPTQKTIILGVDSNREISVLGTVQNEYYWLVAISPDSRYGVYGCDLKSLRMYPDNTFTVIPTDNPILSGGYNASFSKLNNNFYIYSYNNIVEYTMLSNGRTTETGFSMDISPSSANEDIRVSPDGKTCIILSIGDYQITVLRIHSGGGFTLAQQFSTESNSIKEVRFTPDSKYAVVSFRTGYPDLRIYRINWDSTLTETDNIYLPNEPGWKMAVTPDGKFAVTVALIGSKTYFYIVRIHENGTLEYLPDKDYNYNGFVGAIAFVPPEVTCARDLWMNYE